MNRNKLNRLSVGQVTLWICLFSVSLSFGQSLVHPVIYSTQEERPALLNKIKKYSWAANIVQQLHQNVDYKLKLHQKNPVAIASSIHAFDDGSAKKTEQQAAPLAAAHYKILKLASEAGMLYYITEQEAYAQMALDILQVYIEELSPRTPRNTTITGNKFFDPRTCYPHFAITYDFIYPYLKQKNRKVFSQSMGKHILYDNNKAQKAILNMIGSVLQEYGEPDVHGKIVSNHPILTSPGALFNILCIEEDAERERLLNVFWEKGTAHQNSFKNTILPIFSKQGLWPESLSYGFMPIVSMNINIMDRVKPEWDITSKTKNIFKGGFLYDYLRHPDRRFVRYGDSKRNNDFSAKNYMYALNIAQRRNYTEIAEKAKLALFQAYKAKGGYAPNIQAESPYDKYQHLELFWGENIPEILKSEINFNKKTVLVDHAGVALQRNYVEKNNALYGLCGIIGGAHYVHSHVTGITMELYGAEYVMTPNAGLPPTVPERRIPLHEHYFRLYAGNNTVVVNGTSHGRDEGSWKGKANVWQNTVVNIAAEPKHLEDGVSEEFSFATQYLDDTVNHAEQQRTLSTIRTSNITGYYFDIFRSKSKNENRFHDYLYHNLGDRAHLTTLNGNPLAMVETERYQNDIGDVVKSPGWRYFESTRSTDPTSSTIKIRFDVEYDNRYMHMFIPGGVKREYTQALAPATREAKNGYNTKNTQVLAIRQKGEAWRQPFISVFEPSKNKASSIQDIQPLWDDQTLVGAIVRSKTKDAVVTDIIISTESSETQIKNQDLGFDFKGRFAIIRNAKKTKETEVMLYIGEGSYLTYNQKQLNVNKQGSGIMRYSKK